MAIRIVQGADPLSEASLASDDDGIVKNAPSEAGRVLRLELTRYCRGEINGRSFLVAGHRGAGKTTMVYDALDKVLRASRRPGEHLLRPLPVLLHGPSLFEFEAPEASAPWADDSAAMAAQARAALTQIILALHRAAAKEFSQAYRRRNAAAAAAAGPRGARGRALQGAELSAQFEVELLADPPAGRLRAFWEMADALAQGVLFDPAQREGAFAVDVSRVDQGSLELAALNGLCDAHQRISGDLRASERTQAETERSTATSTGLHARGADLAAPVVSVLTGAAVAGGAAAGARSLGGALLAGVLAAFAASLVFKASSTRTTRVGRQSDTTFIPDLSLNTLDRVLPTLVERLRAAGLAPVLVIDELDKVEHLHERLVAMIHFLKKMLAENVFTCFLTDRGYLEQLRMQGRHGAYARAYSYFSHPLLVTYRPVDLDRFLDQVLQADPPPAPGAAADFAPVGAGAEAGSKPPLAGEDRDRAVRETTILASKTRARFTAALGRHDDGLDLEVLKWMLRHRSELHVLSLARELSALRGEGGVVQMAPGVVRSDYIHRIAVTFQGIIELELAQPHVAAWLRQHPDRSQTLLDTVYFPSREWARGETVLDPGPDDRRLLAYLLDRMNLGDDEVPEPDSERALEALPADDRVLLRAVFHDMLGLLSQDTEEAAVRRLWENLPAPTIVPRTSLGVAPLQACLHGGESLLQRVREQGAATYRWRYWSSGARREPVAAEAAAPAPQGPELLGLEAGITAPAVVRILGLEQALSAIAWRPATEGEGRGQVFDMLADRLRLLPTSPAWARVREAMERVDARAAGARAAGADATGILDDMLVIDAFARMLQDNLQVLASALTLAAVLGSLNEDPVDGALLGLDVLSQGLGFASIDQARIVEELEKSWVELEKKSQLRGLRHIEAGRPDAALQLAQQVARARASGKRHLDAVDWELEARDAWRGVEQRLKSGLQRDGWPAATLPEMLCTVVGKGPAPWITLDLRAMTLARWTAVFMHAVPPLSATREVPLRMAGFALGALGAAALHPATIEKLIVWAVGSDTQLALEISNPLHASMLGRRSAPEVDTPDRFAVCVTSEPPAPMADWRQTPKRGLAWVVTGPDLAVLISAGLFERFRPWTVVAFAAGRDKRSELIADADRARLAAAGVGQLRVVYGDQALDTGTPYVVAPRDADEILEHAAPPGRARGQAGAA